MFRTTIELVVNHYMSIVVNKASFGGSTVYDKNARVCSEHFLPTDFVSSVLQGFGPSKRTLKPDAVPSVFSFAPPPKRRKITEARIARAEQQATIKQLVYSSQCSSEPGTSTSISSAAPATRDIGIQCG